jgi:SPP1 gp7 family putative phage head morphogenesis protein
VKRARPQWPGWDRDLETARHYADRLRAAGAAAVDPAAIAEAWAAARNLPKDSKPDGPDAAQIADALAWLANLGVLGAIRAAIEPVLEDAAAEGYLIGYVSAVAMVLETAVDWHGWTPGDADAARLVLDENGGSAGLRALLDAAGVTINGISATEFDRLAEALAEALLKGDSAETLAAALSGIVADEVAAYRIAVTEISRAVSAATLNTYAALGVEASEWLTSLDDRVCSICGGNEDDGPVLLRSAFSSGDTQPPAHPVCRCSLIPVTLTGADAAAALADAGQDEEGAEA